MNTNRQKLLLVISAVMCLSMPLAYGQTVEEVEIEIHHYGLAVFVFVFAGITYSASGYIKQLRRTLAGESVTFDKRKAGMATILGIGLGIGAFVISAFGGEPLAVTDITQAGALWAVATTAILYIDKWILGRADNKAVDPHEKQVQQEILDEEDEDEETEFPPGKN